MSLVNNPDYITLALDHHTLYVPRGWTAGQLRAELKLPDVDFYISTESGDDRKLADSDALTEGMRLTSAPAHINAG